MQDLRPMMTYAGDPVIFPVIFGLVLGSQLLSIARHCYFEREPIGITTSDPDRMRPAKLYVMQFTETFDDASFVGGIIRVDTYVCWPKWRYPGASTIDVMTSLIRIFI